MSLCLETLKNFVESDEKFHRGFALENIDENYFYFNILYESPPWGFLLVKNFDHPTKGKMEDGFCYFQMTR